MKKKDYKKPEAKKHKAVAVVSGSSSLSDSECGAFSGKSRVKNGVYIPG